MKWYPAATNHGMPTPMRTLTAMLPVMWIIAPSAYFSNLVTVLEASMSGKEVPSATNVMAGNNNSPWNSGR